MADVEKIKLAYESGKLDEWLSSGDLTPEKYEEAVGIYHGEMDKSRAGSLGVPAKPSRGAAGEAALNMRELPEEGATSGKPAVVANVGAGARAEQDWSADLAYETPRDLKRASAYVPGTNGLSTEDGSWWDEAKAAIPAELRDFTLMPSRGPVWLEPSDDEARAAIGDADSSVAEQSGLADEWKKNPAFRRTLQTYTVQQWKDAQWAKAYDAAVKRGESIYRDRDINEKSPGFMQTAQKVARTLAPLEGLARGAEETLAFGLPSAIATDLERDVGQAGDDLGIAPFDEAEFESGLQDQLARQSRVVESAPYSKTAGGIAGAMSPGSLTNKVAGGLAKKLGADTAQGAWNAGLRNAGAGAGAAFVESMAVQQSEADKLTAAGLDTSSIVERLKLAATTAGIAAPIAGVLSIPGGVSRAARGAGDAEAAARNELGDTSFFSPSGLKRPPEATAIPPGPEGSIAALRQQAVDAGADDLAQRAGIADAALGTRAEVAAGEVAFDIQRSRSAIENQADELVSRGERLVRATDEQAASFAERLMKRVGKRLDDGPVERKAQTEAALSAEGAPGYEALPGPNNFYSEAALERRANEAIDSGLETDYPSVSAAPIIDRYNRLVQKMAFADDVNIPNTSAQKFRKSVESLFRKKTVPAEEASSYEGLGYDMRAVESESGEEMVEVLIPRRLSARELDDFIKNTDEMSKFPNSPAPEAARFREVGQAAAELRDSAFKVLAATKQKQHLEMLQDEEMLAALGLPRNLDRMTPGDAATAELVMGRIKNLASTPESVVPSELATNHKQLVKWLNEYDPELADQYMTLRNTYKRSKPMEEFGVSPFNNPKARAQSVDSVISAITGDDLKYDAMVEAFSASPAKLKVLRDENVRASGLMQMLGAKPGKMTQENLMAVQTKLHETLVRGGTDYDRLISAVRPEQRAMLDVARSAAQATDNTFKNLGFTAGKWSGAERQEITRGLHSIFTKYRQYGSNEEMNKAIDAAFASNPTCKKALQAMSKDRAFQYLRGQLGEDAKIVFGATKARGYFVASKDFFINHLDALMGSGQTGRIKGVQTPFGAPAAASVGAASPVLGDEALKILMKAYERSVAKEE